MPGLAAAASCTVDFDIHLPPASCRCHRVPRLRRRMPPLAGGAWRALRRMRSVCRKRTSCLRASAPGCKSQGCASLRPSTSTAPQPAHVLDCLRRPPPIPFQLHTWSSLLCPAMLTGTPLLPLQAARPAAAGERGGGYHQRGGAHDRRQGGCYHSAAADQRRQRRIHEGAHLQGATANPSQLDKANSLLYSALSRSASSQEMSGLMDCSLLQM